MPAVAQEIPSFAAENGLVSAGLLQVGTQRQKMLGGLVWFWITLASLGGAGAQSSAILQHQAWGTAEGLPQNSVHAIAQTPDGFLWVATEAGLARFDGLQFRVYGHELDETASEDLCCLAVDSEGVLWVGSSFGLVALKDSQIVALPTRQPFTHNAVRQLSVREGRVEALTEAGTFAVNADGRADRLSHSPMPSPAPGPMLRDRTGTLWEGSSRGLRETSSQNSTTEIPSLAQQSILALLQDTEGDVWVGTETTGLHRLHRGAFHALAGAQGAPAAALAWSPGGVLLGTREGELRLIPPIGEPRLVTRFSTGITALAAASDAVWVGTADGLYRVGSTGQAMRFTSEDGLPDDYIRSLATSSDGDVWAGTAHGLAHLIGAHAEVLTTVNGLGGNLIGALLSAPKVPGHSAAVWVATEAGLSLLEGSHVVQTVDVAGSVVAGTAYLQGALWFATQDGWLWRYQVGSPRKVLQLPAVGGRRSVQSLFADAHGTLWIVLRDGVLSASAQRLNACTAQSCSSPAALTSLLATWGVQDGMPSAESLPGNFTRPAEDARGNIFFATRAGVAVADADEISRPLTVPVVIERTSLEDVRFDAQHLQSIPYGRTRLNFDYAGISLGSASRVRYRVRLRGFDSDWVAAGDHRTATYTALPPASYRFEVQAVLEGQPWPEASTSLTFRIAAPFYRRWWFLTLAALAIVGLLFAIYRLRLRAERRRFALVMAERNRLAREVHDTLAQDLVSAGIQLDVVLFALDKQPHERTSELLRALRRRVAQALAEARDSIGELRDPQVRLDLASRLRRLSERRTTPQLPVTLRITGDLHSLLPGVEVELLRIAGEAIENALRHANATSVTVGVQSDAQTLTLRVSDDGCGFDPADARGMSGHYGLNGMHERADAIGASLAITSAPARGTVVEVSIHYARTDL